MIDPILMDAVYGLIVSYSIYVDDNIFFMGSGANIYSSIVSLTTNSGRCRDDFELSWY